MKKSVLIIYSNGGLDYAQVLQHNLKDIAYTVLEEQLPSVPMHNKLEKLTNQINAFDYGITIVSENCTDDANIVFLIGLLVGNLGIERFAMLIPRSKKGITLSNYLEGFQPNYYDGEHPNKEASIGQAISNIKEQLDVIEKRKTEKDYRILNNKKELLSIAIKSCGKTYNRYKQFLDEFLKCFDCEYNSMKAEPLGIIVFALKDNNLCQIDSGGRIDHYHCFALDEDEKYVVKCYKAQTKAFLYEKIGRFDEDENLYEYIFCKSIYKKYVLTMHIKCNRKIESEFYDEYLNYLREKNKVYIAILQAFLKGGEYCCQNQKQLD